MATDSSSVGSKTSVKFGNSAETVEDLVPLPEGEKEQSLDTGIDAETFNPPSKADADVTAVVDLGRNDNEIVQYGSKGDNSEAKEIEKESLAEQDSDIPNYESKWVNDGVTVLNKIVQDIVGVDDNSVSQDCEEHSENEQGAITGYDFKKHIFSGWIGVDRSGESVGRLNVLYCNELAGTVLVDQPLETVELPNGFVALGFNIEVMEIIGGIRNHDAKEGAFEFEKLDIVNTDGKKQVDISELVKTEKIQSDITILKNNFDEYQLISEEFDSVFYEKNYGDFYDTELDPICHFLAEGSKALYKPNASFDIHTYLYRHIDVEAAGCNPFFHYLKFGRDEKRRYDYAEMLYSEYRECDKKIMADNFDAEFYWYTNPDMIGNEKVVEHYVTHGWREGRDPSPEFDTNYYLEYHPDVKASGMNPYFHYLKYGKKEGRHAIRSRRVFAASAKPSFSGIPGYGEETSDIVTSVAVMVKNEFDIIQSFTSHLLSLFDNVVFIDHNSKDGTLEFIESLSDNDDRVSVFHLEEESYIQALTMNFIVRELDIFKHSDWVFLLDCDEFLPYKNRAELDRELNSCDAHGVLHYFWKNLIPCNYWDYEAKIDSATKFLVPDEPSIFGKIAFKTDLLKNSEAIWIAQGNHSLLSHKDGEPLQHHEAAEPLYHLPIRSINQLALKLNQGVVSYLKIGSKRNGLEGIHWFKILSNLEQSVLSPGLLNRLIVEYGDNSNWTPISNEQLLNTGYQKSSLPIAFDPIVTSARPANNIAGLILQTGASLAANEETDGSPSVVNRLEIQDHSRLVRAVGDNGCEFAELPFTNVQQRCINHHTDTKFLAEFIKPSYWSIDNLTPSAWAGHIPFLFCLVSMMAPRRFAELGSHYGASFFAYCQASARMGYKTEPVAIDCWEGDDHTGSYESDVFEQFKHIFSKYDHFARYKRMFFQEAVSCFDEKSVDLLHIDGLHTYEAVKEDYDTWLYTLSDTGVIIFHDINVHEREFGVWQFWSELKKVHPTMEFMHSHGLGVAYVGSENNHPIMRLIEIFNSDLTSREFLQHHFETISQDKITLAVNEYALADKEGGDRKIAELNHEIGLLNQRVTSLTALNEDYANLIVCQKSSREFA